MIARDFVVALRISVWATFIAPNLTLFMHEYLQTHPDENWTIHAIGLLERFQNPATADQVQRLAEKGSAKIRNFLVPALEYQLATNGSIRWMAFVLAAWFRYLPALTKTASHREQGS